jgi:hypothetical protein
MPEKFITTSQTEKAAYLKVCGFTVEVHDKTNPKRIIWRVSGTLKNGLTAEVADNLFHNGRPHDIVPDDIKDFYTCSQKAVIVTKELHNIINEIKYKAGMK